MDNRVNDVQFLIIFLNVTTDCLEEEVRKGRQYA